MGNQNMNYEETLAYLFDLERFGIKLTVGSGCPHPEPNRNDLNTSNRI
jgi:hypothetical protein